MKFLLCIFYTDMLVTMCSTQNTILMILLYLIIKTLLYLIIKILSRKNTVTLYHLTS